MHLHHLPDDVLQMICSRMLSANDVINLGRAIDPTATLFTVKDFPGSFPDGMRIPWLLSCCMCNVRSKLTEMAETAFFYASHRYVSVYAFLDWSPFRPRKQAAAMYCWNVCCKEGDVRAGMHFQFHDDTIRDAIFEACSRLRYGTHISLYGCMGIDAVDQPILERFPLATSSMRLFPTFLGM